MWITFCWQTNDDTFNQDEKTGKKLTALLEARSQKWDKVRSFFRSFYKK
jgi:hypothetical protein